ncbi:unnamed protein product, partial [Timema podura]|nr:unnamed protein product [Timema podura]
MALAATALLSKGRSYGYRLNIGIGSFIASLLPFSTGSPVFSIKAAFFKNVYSSLGGAAYNSFAPPEYNWNARSPLPDPLQRNKKPHNGLVMNPAGDMISRVKFGQWRTKIGANFTDYLIFSFGIETSSETFGNYFNLAARQGILQSANRQDLKETSFGDCAAFGPVMILAGIKHNLDLIKKTNKYSHNFNDISGRNVLQRDNKGRPLQACLSHCFLYRLAEPAVVHIVPAHGTRKAG